MVSLIDKVTLFLLSAQRLCVTLLIKHQFYKKQSRSAVCVYVVFACTNHSIWAEGIHPFLYQGLHVVLSEVLALLLLFETDET